MPGAPGILRAPYKVPGTTPNSTLIDLGNSCFLAYSPGPGLEQSLSDILPADYKIMLLAPCLGHNLGLKAWMEANSSAELFAPEGLHERLRKKQDLQQIQNLQALETILPDAVKLHVLPENRFQEVWVSVTHGETTYWLMGDAVLNFDTVEGNFIFKFLLGVYGIKPGLRLHKMFLRGLKDKQAFKDWALPLFDNQQKHILLPCHREDYLSPDCGQRMVQLLNELKN